MSKEKKLFIATIVLGAMVPLSIGLSLISDAFLIIGIYCGVGALFGLNILMDWKTEKNPNFILIGLSMAGLGCLFLSNSNKFTLVMVPVSALFAVVGLLISLLGIKNWYKGKRKRSPKVKKTAQPNSLLKKPEEIPRPPLKTYKKPDPCEEEQPPLSIEEAVESLRKQIIVAVTKNPVINYQLSCLLWQDAATCFPNRGFQWDGAWFKLDLKTGKLFAYVSTYPSQFGGSREDSFSLSAAEFHRIATQYRMRPELRAFQSDEDWAMLFNDELNTAIKSAFSIVQQKEEERRQEAIKRYAIKIPADYTKLSPNMWLSEVTIEISQRYSSRSINVTNENGKYQVVFIRNLHTSPDVDRYSRVLSASEAVWLEKRVENAINNPDQSTWQSLHGGDAMHITIKRKHGKNLSLGVVKPIQKYSNLLSEVENLAQYGSLIVE